jgi:WD40 repeat protein
MLHALTARIALHQLQEQGHILLVGTDEGRMHRCSTALSGEAQSSYYGHSDPVYSVHWNRRHPEAFLSASADWTVKLWLSSRSQVTIDHCTLRVSAVFLQTFQSKSAYL